MSDLDVDQPDWPAILRGVQAQLQDRIHTSLPGIVRSYSTETQTAEIQLAVQLQGRNVPPLADVPVCWPGGAAGFVHVPLSAGDTVLVVFCESDISKWLATGSVSAPAVLARHGLHAVAIPGLRRPGAALAVTPGHVTVGATSAVHLGSDTAVAFVALATLVDAQLTALKAAVDAAVVVEGNASGLGGMTALQSALSAWPTTTAATKVKAV